VFQIPQLKSSGFKWMHASPAGLPSGIPGMGLEMLGAMQQAPQPGRQSIARGSIATGA
jgi:hypothetical protein